jgi:hypothetical protein
MLPSSASASHPFVRVGVGIDTSRYGHKGESLDDAAKDRQGVELGVVTANLFHRRLKALCFAPGVKVRYVGDLAWARQLGEGLAYPGAFSASPFVSFSSSPEL